MSGPKVSEYELRLRRLRLLRSQAQNLEGSLQEKLDRLASLNRESASQIRNSLGCSDWEDESALQSYLESLNQAFEEITDAEARIQQNADQSFRSAMSGMAESEGSIETASEILEEIAEITRFDITEANDLLASIGEVRTQQEQGVANKLNAVVSGTASMDAILRADAEKIIAARDQEEAGEIAREALGELGYDVSGEFSTLFVKGGMVHFQKPGWKNYYVRMRVNPDEHYFNLNMVRIGEPDESREQKVSDTGMEHTWCGDYKRLLEEFTRHGIASRNTRAFDPGAVAVQAVSADQIPSAVMEEKSKRSARTQSKLHTY
ncbi:MAG: hypothetical protein WCP20_23325 [Desulfuromonadales bacterium]